MIMNIQRDSFGVINRGAYEDNIEELVPLIHKVAIGKNFNNNANILRTQKIV